MPRKSKSSAGNGSGGQKAGAEKGHSCSAPENSTAGEGHCSLASKGHTHGAPPVVETIERIREAHRRIRFAMKEQQRGDRALEAFVVFDVIGMPKDADAAQRKQVWAQAKTMIGEAVPGLPQDGHFLHASPITDIVHAHIASRAPYDRIRKENHKTLEKLAATLPVWEAFKDVRGFGPASLGVIVAESGDLSNYSNHSKLWKRMGLAVMDGKRQGGLTKNAPKEDWIKHGYVAERRSLIWNIGDALIKANQDGRYRTIYLKRKEIERAKAEALGLTVAPAAKIPAKRASEFMSEGHIHRKAQRYMEKRLLRDLWQAWRGEASIRLPIGQVAVASPAEIREAAE